MTKKRTQQNIYHIDEVNLEIDYDKLAEAIIRADKKARELFRLFQALQVLQPW